MHIARRRCIHVPYRLEEFHNVAEIYSNSQEYGIIQIRFHERRNMEEHNTEKAWYV